MAVPKSSGELISLGGVKWHEPLADYYSKHARDLDRNLEDCLLRFYVVNLCTQYIKKYILGL